MARPARHGPTTVFRFRFRQDDADRLNRIKAATASKNYADAVRHALVIADARLNGGATVAKVKEPGPAQHSVRSTSDRASSAHAAPAPQCPRGCVKPLNRHQLDGACPP